ncbi:MAG: hypothetical protein GY757_10000 [bacterium]|nr:hypothetical protein [bacterium]
MKTKVIDIKSGIPIEKTHRLQMEAYLRLVDDNQGGLEADSILDFDANKHEYAKDGIIIPSVTQVIHGVLPNPFGKWALPYAQKGTYIHQCCELHKKGELDIEGLDGKIYPYVLAWDRYLKESGLMYVPAHIERRLYSPVGFAGTVDYIFPGIPGEYECLNVYLKDDGSYRAITRAVSLETFNNDFRCLLRAYQIIQE